MRGKTEDEGVPAPGEDDIDALRKKDHRERNISIAYQYDIPV